VPLPGTSAGWAEVGAGVGVALPGVAVGVASLAFSAPRVQPVYAKHINVMKPTRILVEADRVIVIVDSFPAELGEVYRSLYLARAG